MPTSRVRIVRPVQSFPTRKPGVQQHIIEAEGEQGFLEQYETVNEFKASLCDRAYVKNLWVDLLWKDSRYGREIVRVDLEKDVA